MSYTLCANCSSALRFGDDEFSVCYMCYGVQESLESHGYQYAGTTTTLDINDLETAETNFEYDSRSEHSTYYAEFEEHMSMEDEDWERENEEEEGEEEEEEEEDYYSYEHDAYSNFDFDHFLEHLSEDDHFSEFEPETDENADDDDLLREDANDWEAGLISGFPNIAFFLRHPLISTPESVQKGASEADIAALKKYISNDSEKNTDCTICTEQFQQNELTELPCRHKYHSECIVQWLELNASCPICRQTVSQSNTTNLENDSNELELGGITFFFNLQEMLRLPNIMDSD